MRADGTAEILEDAAPADGVPEYVEKYRAAISRIGFDPGGFARASGVFCSDPGVTCALAGLVGSPVFEYDQCP